MDFSSVYDIRKQMEETMTKGHEVVKQNQNSVLAVGNVVKTSYGPFGQDKMMIDNTGEITITNDGVTILKNMSVSDPCAKIVVDLANVQDKEAGDGTTTAVLLAAALVDEGSKLILSGIHQNVVISGYKAAFQESLKCIKQKLERKIDKVTDAVLRNIVETTISSKLVKCDAKLFSDIAIQLAKSACVSQNSCLIENISILKKEGGSLSESQIIDGYIVNCIVCQTNPIKAVKNAKIACLDAGITKMKMRSSVFVTVTDPAQVDAIRRVEMKAVEEKVSAILAEGVNVLFASGTIDEVFVTMFAAAGCMTVLNVSKQDLEKISFCTGATIVTDMFTIDGNCRLSSVGAAEEVVQTSFGDSECLVIHAPKKQKISSVVLRGPTSQYLEEADRSLHDSLSSLKRVLESKSLVPGGGTVEMYLYMHLNAVAQNISSMQQLVISRYANSLLTIPKTLCANAGRSTLDLISKVIHNWKSDDQLGIDLVNSRNIDCFAAGIVEPTLVKVKAIKKATETAISILRIERIIRIPEESSI